MSPTKPRIRFLLANGPFSLLALEVLEENAPQITLYQLLKLQNALLMPHWNTKHRLIK